MIQFDFLSTPKQIQSLQSMQEDQLEYQIHRSNFRAEHKRSPCQPILRASKDLENHLVKHQLQQAVDDLVSVCRSEYANGVQGQIFPVQIRKNQQEELQHFLILLEQQLRIRKQEVFPAKTETRRQRSNKELQRVKLIFLQGSEVRDLVLQMYIFLEEHPTHEVVVFIAKQITDLSEQNLYCFDKALKGKRFVTVLCTFATFEGEVQSLVHTHYQKYHITLYNPKELFCRFVYQCVADPNIKAYLPAGVLTLISDMDYYSISFRQSCRRFVYCLERSLMLAHREFVWVEFQELISIIQDSISRRFRLYCGYKNSLQKLLKVILSQKEVYTISQKAVSLQVAMGAHFTPVIDENNLMDSIRQTLYEQLNGKTTFKMYASYLLESEVHPQQDLRRKKSRYDQLGIDTKKNVTPKNKLENQLTRIIKQATQSIRQQASFIKWQDLKFELRIRPQIPRLIMQSMTQGETQDLTKQILCEYAAPVSKYFSHCESQNYGRLIYLLKTLQISGLVDLSKKQQKPNVYNQFFEKCMFSGKH